ncbi:hypothetical protein EAO71_06515, partial [Streptomyces sp. ms191]|uniref:hypothetical protein n=1 Tax=Streptomyces sp. ms191 TaxID=1827978 RepID=UPI0013115209
VPLFTACVWLTLTSDLLWGYALLVLVGHQTLTAVSGQIFFYKFWPLSVVTTYFFLHRVDWWHPSLQVAAPLFCAFTLLSMVGVAEGVEALAARHRRAVATADRIGAHSVAIPPLGSGHPAREAAAAVVRALRDTATSVELVRLVTADPTTHAALAEAVLSDPHPRPRT